MGIPCKIYVGFSGNYYESGKELSALLWVIFLRLFIMLLDKVFFVLVSVNGKNLTRILMLFIYFVDHDDCVPSVYILCIFCSYFVHFERDILYFVTCKYCMYFVSLFVFLYFSNTIGAMQKVCHSPKEGVRLKT